jgi:hypothetical protein
MEAQPERIAADSLRKPWWSGGLLDAEWCRPARSETRKPRTNRPTHRHHGPLESLERNSAVWDSRAAG